MRADHLVAGAELLLRHQAAAVRKAPRAVAVYASRGASTTSATARCRGQGDRPAESRMADGGSARVEPRGRPARRPGAARARPMPRDGSRSRWGRRGTRRRLRGGRRRHRAETFEELVEYCRCVAGSIGRLSLGVFGTAPRGTRGTQPPGRPARGRPAADQHPARHPRGPRQRPRLPTRTRTWPSSACDLRVDDPARLEDPPAGSPPNPIRRPARRRLVRRRPAARARSSTGAARRAPARWPASITNCWSGSRRPGLVLGRGCRCRRREGAGRRARPGRKRAGDDRQDASGGRRGTRRHHRGDRVRRRRAPTSPCSKRRPRLGGATCSFQPGRPDRRHRPAHLPAAVARPTAACWTGSGTDRATRCRTGSTYRPGPGRAGPAAPDGVPAPAASCGPPGRGIGVSISCRRASVVRARWRCAWSTRADPAADTQRFGDWLAGRGRASGPTGRCGTCSASRR